MRGLHRGNHAEPGEARNVLRADHLGVLDSETMVGLGKSSQRSIESIEHDAVAAIANGVDVDLKPVLQRPVRPGANVLRTRDEQSRIGRFVAVWSEQRRAARSERAVGVQLDGADPEVTVVEVALWSALEVRIALRGR